MLVNDLGADFVRVEANAMARPTWEATNDDADPMHIQLGRVRCGLLDVPRLANTFDYIRYLNQLGVAHVELAAARRPAALDGHEHAAGRLNTDELSGAGRRARVRADSERGWRTSSSRPASR
jgi:hypothetical protein